MKKIHLSKLIKLLESRKIVHDYCGTPDLSLECISSFDRQFERSISFYRGDNPNIVSQNSFNQSSILIVKIGLKEYIRTDQNILYVENPDLAICLIGELFKPTLKYKIDSSAEVHQGAKISTKTLIKANVIIYGDVEIGKQTIIEEGVILKNCKIGDNCHIYPGVKIGSQGLGTQRNKDGSLETFPHFGKVLIGSNVIIQDNSVIARGSLNDTVIKDGVVIGPLSWLAHGVRIESNVLIGQCVAVAGSVKIGENSTIWANSSIRDGISIGRDCTIGMGSVVVKDIDNGSLVFGNPAMSK